MKNFVFHNPTRIIFGKDQAERIAKEIPADARVLILYGGGSAKKSGLIDEIRTHLEGRALFEFGGIEPNPYYETLMKAVALARAENITFLVAVGGGSVIDGTKFVSAAIPFEGDAWEIVSSFGRAAKKALPFGAVLTLAATGSEWNNGAVITRAETKDKISFANPHLFPKFSLLDPTKTYSVPPNQTANGVIDAFIHVVEQYLTLPAQAPLQDRMSEGILLTLIEEGPKALANPEDYDARANIMLCASMALNGLIAIGVPQDWASHLISHELTVLFGLAHGEALAVVLPGVMQNRREGKKAKLLQFARRVWNITEEDEEKAIDQAIAKTEEFFRSLGVKTKLPEYGLGKAEIDMVIAQLERHGIVKLGEKRDITPDVSRAILEARL